MIWLKSQAEKNQTSNNTEIASILIKLELTLAEWSRTYEAGKNFTLKNKHQILPSPLWIAFFSSKKGEIDEDDLEEYINELREHEKALKKEALDLILQFGSEAVGMGVSFVGGIEFLAFIEGVQASKHFVEGCEKYNEAKKYEKMADELEEQYFDSEEAPVKKKWWELWK